jgi:phosphoribosylformylglycinamidine synthase subunit PurS
VPTIVVEVMPKAELLDPQGKAVAGALGRLGKSRFTGVRVGKRFELTVDGPADDAVLAEVQELAETILSNSVIEDVISVHFAGVDGFGTSADADFESGNVTEDHDVIGSVGTAAAGEAR